MVSVQDVKNALEMTLDDEVSNSDDVSKGELKQVTKRFTQLMDTLSEQASDEDTED